MFVLESSGTLELNGRAETLLGKFERRYLDEKNNNSSINNIFSVGNFFGGDISERSSEKNRQQVATKFAPYPWRVTRGSLVQAAKESLKRLDQDKLCVAQLHWSTANYQPFQEGETHISAFHTLISKIQVVFLTEMFQTSISRCTVGRDC